MKSNTEPKVIIIDESIVESAMLMVLLSPLTRNQTICLNYSRGENALRNAAETNEPFDIVFLALPPDSSLDSETAVRVLAQALSSGNPFQTVIMGGDKLPHKFDVQNEEENNVLHKPITKAKLQQAIEPLGLTLPKLNCWEYMGCGREPGGSLAVEQGVCAAAAEQAANGLHHGVCGGRACWAVSGTLCGGTVQGSFASKIQNCLDCDFYRLVQYEEGDFFESIDSILSRINRNKK